MKEKKSLKEIADFVEKKAKKPIGSKKEDMKDYKEIMKLLEENSKEEKIDFTLTIGNLNAYLG